ncbi:hypothetical protein TWF173_007596 [Orbilia oligospora]|uniref:MARVEL domain-containing protein n=2 Tax=Orbilia oligospora TaxID=2813651 RepID=G1XA83_ARTOA|nr:hypothetical protein AOL_s00076g541 [Orbilia oligospora ATCC 24927]EGX49900.1 hypothetical protein AOL_s00076g541 [Orbilia oligospora ATCC 24927]KAF3276102.1 hypothetical protein TWF970_006387 [Orbilia oligospora]KAF3311924.1 hypothetical protein TWF173_007596 [Orbilia oligospora]
MFFEKTTLWFFRIAQWCLCVSLLGISGYLVNEYAKANSRVPPEIWLPCITSAFAICILFYSITLLCCLGRLLLHIAAFFDFCFMVTYIAGVVLNRYNFHQDGTQNRTWQHLTWTRQQAGIDNHANKNLPLVKALAGLTTTLMVLYIITTLLCINLARLADEKHEEKTGHRRRSSSHV